MGKVEKIDDRKEIQDKIKKFFKRLPQATSDMWKQMYDSHKRPGEH